MGVLGRSWAVCRPRRPSWGSLGAVLREGTLEAILERLRNFFGNLGALLVFVGFVWVPAWSNLAGTWAVLAAPRASREGLGEAPGVDGGIHARVLENGQVVDMPIRANHRSTRQTRADQVNVNRAGTPCRANRDAPLSASQPDNNASA